MVFQILRALPVWDGPPAAASSQVRLLTVTREGSSAQSLLCQAVPAAPSPPVPTVSITLLTFLLLARTPSLRSFAETINRQPVALVLTTSLPTSRGTREISIS